MWDAKVRKTDESVACIASYLVPTIKIVGLSCQHFNMFRQHWLINSPSSGLIQLYRNFHFLRPTGILSRRHGEGKDSFTPRKAVIGENLRPD